MEIFRKYANAQKYITLPKFLEFLHREQCESSYDKHVASDLITTYEPIMEALKNKCMTMEGFARFMSSPNADIFSKEHRVTYQDMTLPLSNYFISTSHNTYLTSDQLVGQSDIMGYASALLRGCRCIEIDCWDGPDGDPIVYHGYTLTSKLLFKTVISAIEECAFVASHYPVILSLENHCSPRQQDLMAFYLTRILNDKLLSETIGNSGHLPSPEELKYKILIKNKKLAELRGKFDNRVTGAEVAEFTDYDDYESAEEEIPETPSKKSIFSKLNPLKKSDEPRNKMKVQKRVLSKELSDLVIYTKSEKFVSFQHSREQQQFYENNSLSEKQARKLARESAHDFIHHTMNFITRIYPKGLRAASSNFNPQEFWNVGCQMVALNFQTPGLPMDLLRGKFLDNGGCGFVIKPECLRDRKCRFNPYDVSRTPATLSVTIISGFQLPPCSLSMASTNPVVSVEIFGVPADQAMKQTDVKKCDAFNPQWNETLTFQVHIPELAMVRFCVEDQISLFSNEFLGQYTLPFTSLTKGKKLSERERNTGTTAVLMCHYEHYVFETPAKNSAGIIPIISSCLGIKLIGLYG
ncbi:1-phosphatidylinositol 4,5-bisphosphate phosphodiesterase zeta-1 [Bombina bombina]|uniref:1-phosphatidylinositol 4,5-bisphosphate phosphodiesterase zeta-1 n=1 Tax=Bombina bombina TaxID=8345 RepID=UPI00235A7B45|nr:1-phosphatidylinositol 4,5-bisphosphate phosphodiesterase zeta-1 [Bombina bombina]